MGEMTREQLLAMTGQETLGLCTRASRRPLHEPPEGESDVAGGPTVLAYRGSQEEGAQGGPGGGAASPS
jgi:hypothetical protein